MRALGAALLGAGALVLLVKGAVILATGAFVWEDEAIAVAFLFAHLGLAALATLAPSSRWRIAALVATAAGAVAGSVNLALSSIGVPDSSRDPLYAASTLALLAALVAAGIAGRPSAWARASLVTGILFVPVTLIGGALSFVEERLLETGVVALAGLLGWIAVAARDARADPDPT